MAARLRKITPPQIRKVEEEIIKVIEELMREMLDHPSMPIESKKSIIERILRLSSGL